MGLSRSSMKPLRVVVFQEDDWLCAHYIDFNLCAQAKTMPALYRALHKLIVGHIVVRRRHNMVPFADLPPAPEKYRQWYEQSVDLPPQIIRVPRDGLRIPAPKVRVLVAKPVA